MDKVVSKIAGLGIPGLILLVTIEATGLCGAAAITMALSTIGPGGMMTGIMSLCLIALIMEGIAEFGFTAIFCAVVRELIANGESKASIKEKISKYPISKSLKRKLFELLSKEYV